MFKYSFNHLLLLVSQEKTFHRSKGIKQYHKKDKVWGKDREG